MKDKVGDTLTNGFEAELLPGLAHLVARREDKGFPVPEWPAVRPIPRIIRLAMRYDRRLRHHGRTKDVLGDVGYEVLEHFVELAYFQRWVEPLPLAKIVRRVGRSLISVRRVAGLLERHGFLDRLRRYGFSGSRVGADDDMPISIQEMRVVLQACLWDAIAAPPPDLLPQTWKTARVRR
jgi:hypothetical protein